MRSLPSYWVSVAQGLRPTFRRHGCVAAALFLTAHLGHLVAQVSGATSAAAAAAAVAAAAAGTGIAPPAGAIAATGTSGTTTAVVVTAPARVVVAPHTSISDPAWRDASSAVDTTQSRASHPARLINLSVRGLISRDRAPLIAGAVARGTDPLPLLVRAIGPGLTRFGVTGALTGPELSIYHGNTLAAQTNTLDSAAPAVSAFVGAFPAVAATGDFANGDAALVGSLNGALTAHCGNSVGNSGIALLEFYDAHPAASATSSRFVNFSARAGVGTGEGTLVVGFVVAGEGTVTLLLRGVGPTLGFLSSIWMLQDPLIELYSGGALIAANDNWGQTDPATRAALRDAQSAVGAFALTTDDDAALLVTLPAGAYTLHVRAASGVGEVALAEIYEVATGDFDAARATNAVGLDLFRELTKTAAGQNVVISPYSIESALALAYAGADGVTREEMARVLRFPADNPPLQAGFAALRSALEQVAADSITVAQTRTARGAPTDPIQWNAANRLFGQHDYAFRESFLTLMRDGFAAPLASVDFRTQTEAARLAINTWVEEQTREKIRDLIPRGGVSELTRLVLVNALYLKAPWDAPFPKTATAPRAFRPTPDTSRDVPTMQTTGELGYAVESGRTIVSVDYLGRGLQFLIVLPDEGQTAETAAAALTPVDFARWAKLARRQVALSLPKFKVEGATVALSAVLQTLGMRSAFDIPMGSANFDGIAPRRGGDYLSISNVFHQTFIALDEEGTEAAAATAVVTGVTSAPPTPVPVRVDRPFLFAIQHRASGACLFLGRITEP